MLRHAIIVLGVLSFAFVAQAATGNPTPACLAAGCSCSDWNTTTCLAQCNVAACAYHSGQCTCDGATVPTPTDGAPAPTCTTTTIGAVCNYTCPANTSPNSQGLVCVSNGPAAVGGSWQQANKCLKQCGAVPATPTNVNSTNCTIPANSGNTCNTYTCNDATNTNGWLKTTGQGAWTCVDGTWVPNNNFCVSTVCTTMPTSTTTATKFYCNASIDNPIMNGTACSYDCTGITNAHYIPTEPVWCVNGGWTNPTSCVPSCRGNPADASNTTTLRTGCIQTQVVGVDGNVTTKWLSARNGDQCPMYCNTGLDQAGGLSQWWWGTIGSPSPLGELAQPSCWNSWTCSATDSATTTGIQMWTKTNTNVQECFQACLVGDLLSTSATGGDLVSNSTEASEIACAYTDPATKNTYYISADTKTVTDYAAPFPNGFPKALPHGWKCRVQCPSGYTHSGGEGPYCYDGKWITGSRTGHRSSQALCMKIISSNNNNQGSESDGLPCSDANLTTTTAAFKAAGFVELDSCPTFNSTLYYNHGRAFRLRCDRNGATVLSGASFIECVNGNWLFGGKTNGTSVCVPPTTSTCPPLNAGNVLNSAADWQGCNSTSEGGYCTPKCATGFAPKFDYVNTTDPYSWWGKGLKCINSAAGLKWNLDVNLVCVDSCSGRQTGTGGTSGPMDTAGGCPDVGIGCDYFCNIAAPLNNAAQNTSNGIALNWRDCTTAGCAYDGGACDPPTAVVTLDILAVGVRLWTAEKLPGNAWVGIYRQGEVNNYRFLAAKHVGAAPVTDGSIFFTINVDQMTWMYNDGVPQWWGGNGVTRNTSLVNKGDLEVRVFPDLSVGADTKPLNTSTMCGSIANSCTGKWARREFSVQEAHIETGYNAVSLVAELNARRARQLTVDAHAAAKDAFNAHFDAEYTHGKSRHHDAQGALNQNNAVVPLACLAETNCTCAMYGDGTCHPDCNNPQCGWDAGDCFCQDYPVNATTGAGSDVGPYANRSCTASAFGAGTKNGTQTGTNTTSWKFVIGAQCTLACPDGWDAIPANPGMWGVNLTAGVSRPIFQSMCRPDANSTNGGSWDKWSCRKRCTADPILSIPAGSARDNVVANSAAECLNNTLGFNKYWGQACFKFDCNAGQIRSSGYFVCNGDQGVNSDSAWQAVGQFCIDPPKSNCSLDDLNTMLTTGSFQYLKRGAVGGCEATGNVTNGTICALDCTTAGFTPTTGIVNRAICLASNWVVTGQCVGPCDSQTWKAVVTTSAVENNDQVIATADSAAGLACPAASLPLGSTPGCALGCNPGFRVWNNNAALTRNWKCGLNELCSIVPAGPNVTANWAIAKDSFGQPRCYSGCKYGDLKTLLNVTTANDTLWVQHADQPVATNLICPTGSTANGGNLPFCYRNSFVWYNLKGQMLTNWFACNWAPTPPTPSAPSTPPATPSPAAPSPPVQCTIEDLIKFNTTIKASRPGSYVADSAFTNHCQNWNALDQVDGFDAWCGYPAAAPTKITCSPTGNWTWVPTCACGRIPDIANADMATINTNAIKASVGTLVDVVCQPGYTALYRKMGSGTPNNWWLPGAICTGSISWDQVPVCAPACEGWTTTNASWVDWSSPQTCDSTNPALCDWFCGAGIPAGVSGTPHLECSTPACKAKGVEAQCRTQSLSVTIEPTYARLNWQFSRDVSQTAFFAFYTEATGADWQWAINVPQGKNLGNTTNSVNIALNGGTPVANDWQLNNAVTYDSWAHGDLWVKVFEDHSRTIPSTTETALAKFGLCSSNMACAKPAPVAKVLSPRDQKCQNMGCDCSRLADGVCDLSCNIAECGWDKGDCGCAAPNNATVRSAATWSCSAPVSNSTGQPAYGVNATCSFTCPAGYIVRDMTIAGFPAIDSSNLKTTCLADAWSLSGGRWQSFACEAPCKVAPPVINNSSQQITWAPECANQNSGSSACTWQCTNNTWWTGSTSKKALCVDGKYERENYDFTVTPTLACSPVCFKKDIPAPVGNSSGWTCTTDYPVGTPTPKCLPVCNTGFKPNGNGFTCTRITGDKVWLDYGNWTIDANITCDPLPPPGPVQLTNCSINQLNAWISNGQVVNVGTDCQGGERNYGDGDDITVTPGTACTWACEPGYVHTGGDPNQQERAICNSNGVWGPNNINQPRCLAPCFNPPPVDGGAHCGQLNLDGDAVPVGGSCQNWGCDPDFVRDQCGQGNPQCLNSECSACKYNNGGTWSSVNNCSDIVANQCGNNEAQYSSPFRHWELVTPYTQFHIRYRLPYCFRPCNAQFLIERSPGLASCSGTSALGNIVHGKPCVPTCAAGYVLGSSPNAICYDGAFRGDLNNICIPPTSGCVAGQDCCRTSELTQPWNAQIAGDVNIDTNAASECREFWTVNDTVQFQCNSAPSNGNPAYKWYSGSDNVLLGDGATLVTAQCGSDGKWWYWYNNAMIAQPKCKSQTVCGQILYDPAVWQAVYSVNGNYSYLGEFGTPVTSGTVQVDTLDGNGTRNLQIICNSTGPGGDCVIQCADGFSPVWDTVSTAGQNTHKYGPICDRNTNSWINIPRCVPSCIASGCAQPRNYSTACDGVCQDDIGDYECSGPACNWDAQKCAPRQITFDIKPLVVQIEITSDKPLPNSAWVAGFRNKESNDTGNFRWSGATKVAASSAKNSYKMNLQLELDTTQPNSYIDGQLEVKLFHDAALKQALGSAMLCEPCQFCKGFDTSTCPVIPPPAAPVVPAVPAPPSPPATPLPPQPPAAPLAPGDNGTAPSSGPPPPNGPTVPPECRGFAADADKYKSDAKLWLILFIVFLVISILLLIGIIVLFLKLKAAGSAKSGAAYSQL